MLRQRSLLAKLSLKAIKAGQITLDQDSIRKKWLGTLPARLEQIEQTQKDLNCIFRPDLVEFYLTTNGFLRSTTTSVIIAKLSELIWLRDYDPGLISTWKETGNEDESKLLLESLVLGDYNREQFLLYVPSKKMYWYFASWMPGGVWYETLDQYLADLVDSLKERAGK
jgi:hypothetical protein